MKKILSLVFAVLLTATALVSCGDSDAANTTVGGGDSTTTAPSKNDEPKLTLPPMETTDKTETEDDDARNFYDFPNATYGDLKLNGYEASGFFDVSGEKAVSTSPNAMFVVTNDSMLSGKLTATFSGDASSAENDNGIIFGMEEDVSEQYFFWENGPAYYFLFVSDARNLYLAKVTPSGNVWNVLKEVAIPNYAHGDTVTITAEFDGAGTINCYANNELLIEYKDAAPLSGTHYGVRCEVAGVTYDSVVAEHN